MDIYDDSQVEISFLSNVICCIKVIPRGVVLFVFNASKCRTPWFVTKLHFVTKTRYLYVRGIFHTLFD